MTPEIKIALIGSIGPTIAGLAALGAVILSHIRSGRKLDHITFLTNSTLTAANRRIDELELEVKALRLDLDGKL